jgi:hypothetical protein
MIDITPKKSHGKFEIIDPKSYITSPIFREAEYRAALRNEDWDRFTGKRVLLRGCGKIPIPPWAYMLLVTSLGNRPAMIAYGEECAPVVVFKNRVDAASEPQDVLAV